MRRANPLIAFLDELFPGGGFGWYVTPVLFPHFFMQQLSKSFSQAVGQGLDHDTVVVIELALESRDYFFNSNAGRHGEPAYVILDSGLPGG